MMGKPYSIGMSGSAAADSAPAPQADGHRWQRRYAGRLPAPSKAVRQLRDKNARLKKPVAELRLDKASCRTSPGCAANARSVRRRAGPDHGYGINGLYRLYRRAARHYLAPPNISAMAVTSRPTPR